MSNKLVLVVDDEQHILDLLAYNLRLAGYEAATARSGREALRFLDAHLPALIILDMMMPEMSGSTLCKLLKSSYATSRIPIIILSARNEEIDKILALENGADDYVTKPFSVRELMARINALLRRSAPPKREPAALSCGGLSLDADGFEVCAGGEAVALTSREYDLLRMLMEQPNRVLTRDYLMDRIWGYEFYGEARTVDVHIRHLRQKLGTYADCVQTVRGIGYKFVPREEGA